MGNRKRVHEERRDPRMPTEPGESAHVVDDIVVDRILGASTLDPFGVLLVGSPVSYVDMLRVRNGDAAASDVGDVVANDVGIDDVVDHRDPLITAVFDHIADDVDRIGAVHHDHPWERVDDLVLGGVPITRTVGDESRGPLYARLAVGVSDIDEAVVAVGEGDALDGEVLDPVRGRGPGDTEQAFRHRRLDIRRAHVLARARIVVERSRGLVEVELPRRGQPGEYVEDLVRACDAEAGAPARQLGDDPIGLLQHQPPIAVGSGDHIPGANDVLVPGRAVDDLQIVLVAGDGWHICGGVRDPVATAATVPRPRGLSGGNGIGPGPAFRRDGLAGHVGSRVVHVQVSQLGCAVQRGLVDTATAHGPPGDLRCAVQYRRFTGVGLIVDPVVTRT